MQTRKGFLHSPHLVVDWRSNDITLIRCACASERCVGYNQSIADNVKGKGFGLNAIHISCLIQAKAMNEIAMCARALEGTHR